MSDNGKPALPVPREMTKEELEAHVQQAFALEQTIKTLYRGVHEAWWVLSEALYRFHELGGWHSLGYETLDEFLAQPDLGMSRRQFFQMTKMWRDLVVVREIPEAKLKQLEPSKVRQVAPAISNGEVEVEDALEDVEALSYRDLGDKYHGVKVKGGARKKLRDDDDPLDAAEEPNRVQCDFCGSWYVPDPDEEDDDE